MKNNLITKIPTGWEVKELRYIGEFSSSGIDKKINPDEPLVKIVNYTDIYGNETCTLDNDKDYMVVSCQESRIQTHLVKKGDLIFTPSSETIEDIGVSALVLEDLQNTAFSYHVLRFQFKQEFDLNFKKYLCNNYFVLNQFSAKAQGTTRKTLDRNDFKTTLVFVPPLSTQQKIATFLDQKTTEIDNLISKKNKMISLLKEEEKAFINEKLQEKTNWTKKKLKYVAELKSGNNITSDLISPSGDYLVYGGNGIRGYFHSYTHEGNHILIGRQGALCGNINNAQGKFWASEHAIVVTIIDGTSTQYLSYLLEMMNLNQYSQSAAQPGLSVENLKNLQVSLPSLSVQSEIVSAIGLHLSKSRLLIEKSMQEVILLKEYRQSLISECVSGGMEV